MGKEALFILNGLPADKLRGNSRATWQVRARYVREARTDACMMGRKYVEDHPDVEFPLTGNIAVNISFQTVRPNDMFNLLHGLKSFFDGLEDAGVIDNDGNIRHAVLSKKKGMADCIGVLLQEIEE